MLNFIDTFSHYLNFVLASHFLCFTVNPSESVSDSIIFLDIPTWLFIGIFKF